MSEALSLDDFASQLAQSGQAEQPVEESAPVEQQEGESEGQQPEATEVEADPEAKAEGEAEAEESPEDQPEEPESPDERVVKWTTANGEAFEVSEKELRDGYMRQSHFTQQMQNVAKEREQVQQLASQQIQEVQQFASEIGQVQMLESTLKQYQQVNWQQLREADPVSYQEHLAQFTELKQQYRDASESLANKRANYAQQSAQKFEQEQAQQRALAEQHLAQVFPGITNKDTNEMFKTLYSKGATQQDIAVLTTRPWAVEMAIYAQKWLALQAEKPKAVKKVASVPQKPSKAVPAAPTRTEQLARSVAQKRTFSGNEFADLLASTRKR
jgi:hypothetical protein